MNLLWLVLGCMDPPTEVDKDAVQTAFARKNVATVCVGLQMDDPDLQEFSTKAIRDLSGDAVEKCICDNLIDEEGNLREGVAKGLKGEEKNERAECFAKLITNPKLKDPKRAADLFADMEAPIVNTSLNNIAHNKGVDPEIRAYSLSLLASNAEYIDSALMLVKDSNPKVQASALYALGFHVDSKEARRAIFSNRKSSKPEVRAAALFAFKKHMPNKADDELCDAILNDSEAVVRKAALKALEGFKRRDAARCMRTLAMREEPDAEVREQLLATLKSAQGDGEVAANKVLCDAIPFWLRTYIKDDVVTNLKGVNIVKAQNDVDFQNSLKCFEKAYRSSSGYSCYAKMHIALWYNLVSGKDKKTPLCPGMDEYSE